MALLPPPSSSSSSLVFKVHRREPELLLPEKPTPHEFKNLSDIDDQEGLRSFVRCIVFFRNNPSMEGKDPVKIIREAMVKTLVFYYPLAGRLREGENGKLMVECNGEGILFTEADAEVTLEQLGGTPQPPYPCMDELLYDVTRLKCGGFSLGIRYNHAMVDGQGLAQFVYGVSEISRGAEAPSILPVWERHLLSASDPPKVTYQHLEYVDTAPNSEIHHEHLGELVDRSFAFGAKEVATLKSLVPQGKQFTSFEILTACLWKCRTIALQLDPDQEVRVMCVVNARNKFKNPPLPIGYYGNAFVLPVALTTAGELTQNPIEYALELVQKAKGQFSQDYVRSVASLMVTEGRPHFITERTFGVSDIKHSWVLAFDFGWGHAVSGGSADAGSGEFPGCSYLMPYTDKEGGRGMVASLSLPSLAVERFQKELDTMLNNPPTTA
ncbi:hypothetical protein Tsubulata_022994 [Turnera subulata]|uniref:Uncharacterized protein n=1 Tax=Turnera subulata TaxID=218843 RepID=A0A9Q0JQL9_9ROSI|nr:hypothetical protein Tsubulata_022994 [Turnera subulata]